MLGKRLKIEFRNDWKEENFFDFIRFGYYKIPVFYVWFIRFLGIGFKIIFRRQ